MNSKIKNKVISDNYVVDTFQEAYLVLTCHARLKDTRFVIGILMSADCFRLASVSTVLKFGLDLFLCINVCG